MNTQKPESTVVVTIFVRDIPSGSESSTSLQRREGKPPVINSAPDRHVDLGNGAVVIESSDPTVAEVIGVLLYLGSSWLSQSDETANTDSSLWQ